METIKNTVLHDRHLKLGAKMAPFAGYDMPIEYTGIVEEHLAVRQKAGIFDVSHMGEIRILGKDAAVFVDYLTTNKATGAESGRVIYTILCTPEGGVIDDLLIYKMTETEIFLVVNASNIAVDYAWLVDHKGKFAVTITNESDMWAEIALQGPKSEEILQPLIKDSLTDLYFMHFKWIHVGRHLVLISRSGYTGEDGFEIYGEPAFIATMWDKLVKHPDITPCGLGCRDTLRFEASLPLYGHELSRDITPVECGFGFAIKWDKDFIGKGPLLEQKNNGAPKSLVGIELIDRGIARQGYEVQCEGKNIGVITTGYMLPGREKALALALIETKYATIGQPVEILIRGKAVEAKVRDLVFYQKKYKRK